MITLHRIARRSSTGIRDHVRLEHAHYTPTEWAQAAIALYRQHKADRIVAEVNNGGDMVEATLRMIDPDVPYTAVHASRGEGCCAAASVPGLWEQQQRVGGSALARS